MTAILRREVGAYFRGVLGWLFAAFILVFAGIYTMAYNLSGAYSNFEYVLSAIGFIYLIAVPILTMRSIAEERKTKTDQLLYALPVSMTGVVVGKYLAMLVTLLVPTAILALYPLILTQFGTVSLTTAYGTLLAFYLLGASLLSIGLFISSLTESQVASAVITLVTVLLLYFMKSLSSFVDGSAGASLIALSALVLVFALILWGLSKNPIVAGATALAGIGALAVGYVLNASVYEGLFASFMSAVSVFDRFNTFVDGVFDWTAIVYYLSVIGVMLFLTTQSMEKRRWSE